MKKQSDLSEFFNRKKIGANVANEQNFAFFIFLKKVHND